ncbi:MAG: metallophosphoesterase family protein [Chloroflexi bacterium]|nr:metallophosphoesterase family protein [Chloroflexota bacterium]
MIERWRGAVEIATRDRRDEPPPEAVVAVISDVHAIAAALDAVLESAHANGATQVWCLGDLIGRGPSPQACLDRLGSLGPAVVTCWLLGNHEAMALGLECSPRERASADAVTVADLHRPALHEAAVETGRAHYRQWPWPLQTVFQPILGGPVVMAVHGGAPAGPVSIADRYTDSIVDVVGLGVYAEKSARDSGLPAPGIVLAGHTHVVDAWTWTVGDPMPRQIVVEPGIASVLKDGEHLYLNVGSSGGWARGASHEKALPTYGLLRFSATSVTWSVIEVEADLERERALMGELGYPRSLADELAGVGALPRGRR